MQACLSHDDRRARTFLARRFPDEIEATMRDRFDLIVNEHDAILSAAELAAAAKGCRYLFVSATESLPSSLFDALAPELEVVGTLSVGYDHIAVDSAKAHGVSVLHTPDVLSEACAEIAMMLLLNAARRGYESDALVRSGAWRGWGPTQLLGLELTGRRLAILGMGRIGREVAQRARGFGLQIHYHNRTRLPSELEAGANYHGDRESFLAHADILLIAAPGTPALRGFLDRDAIAGLPADSIVVNISRGDIVDDDALIAALQDGRVFAAGLDVFRDEPNIDPRYRRLSNVFLSAHIGSATTKTRNAMGQLLLDGVAALQAGRRPANELT